MEMQAIVLVFRVVFGGVGCFSSVYARPAGQLNCVRSFDSVASSY